MKTETELRSDCHCKTDLCSEIYPNTEFNMLRFITTFLGVLDSARIKFDV